jgi:Fe(3+) dicitrate transport protein
MRGTSPNRSEKITLMEDGFLFHRHHTLLLQRIISHSEQNAIFRNIKRWKPDSIRSLYYRRCYQHGFYSNSKTFSGRVTASIGSFNTKKTYVNIGDEHKNYGYVLEYNNRNSDGFKTIDNSSKNTGFRGNDYVAKFRVNSDADAKYINR